MPIKPEHADVLVQFVVPEGHIRQLLLEFLDNHDLHTMYLPADNDLPTYTLGPGSRGREAPRRTQCGYETASGKTCVLPADHKSTADVPGASRCHMGFNANGARRVFTEYLESADEFGLKNRDYERLRRENGLDSKK